MTASNFWKKTTFIYFFVCNVYMELQNCKMGLLILVLLCRPVLQTAASKAVIFTEYCPGPDTYEADLCINLSFLNNPTFKKCTIHNHFSFFILASLLFQVRFTVDLFTPHPLYLHSTPGLPAGQIRDGLCSLKMFPN